ncbi:CLUMA_CG017325, isoform A [Clunio marinus]|uniref:Amino acid transporter n=1 Tax=Clunio marinus TaxID=568069 RepID=A0A1J1IXC7_9DIPT|nr:CLUMA_CG017325, isoform A [Clunio marinus]
MRVKVNIHVREHLLTILTVSAVVCGVIAGIIVRAAGLHENEEKFHPRTVMYVNFIGDIFLRMLKALILPLIVSSLVAAVGSLDISLSKRIGTRAIAYYMLTTVLAVLLGIILVSIIQPGRGGVDPNDDRPKPSTRAVTTADTMLDLVRNIFPPNLVQATIQQYQTELQNNSKPDMSDWDIKGRFTDGMNIMGLVVASVVFGIAISSARQQTRTLLMVFNELSQTMMRITGWVIWLSPIGVFFLILSKMMEMKNVVDVFAKLGLYLLTVSGGILFHGFVILPSIFFLVTRKNPLKFIGNMGQAIATAFGTSSSSATLPVTIQCLEQNNKIDSRVSRFVLPIGATINMDGTALYEAVAAIFIAQLRGVNMTLTKIFAVSITATAASIGAAGIPQAGLVTLVMVLDTVGLPAEDVSLVIAVDWILDRIRTVVNVLGDSFGAAIVEHFSKNEIKAIPDSITINNNLQNGTSLTVLQVEERTSSGLKGRDNAVFDERM